MDHAVQNQELGIARTSRKEIPAFRMEVLETHRKPAETLLRSQMLEDHFPSGDFLAYETGDVFVQQPAWYHDSFSNVKKKRPREVKGRNGGRAVGHPELSHFTSCRILCTR